MYLPRVMRPLPAVSRLTSPDVQRIAVAPFSLVHGPAGSYVAEWLAAAIHGWDRWDSCVWLRTANLAPVALTESLVSACLHRWTDDLTAACQSGVQLSLDQAMRRAPAGAVVVLELQRWVSPEVIRLVRDTRQSGAGRGVTVVAVAEGRWPVTLFGSPDCAISTAALSEPTVLADGAGLPRWCPHRLRVLAGRRAAIRHDVLDAARSWPTDGTSVLRYLLSRRGHTCTRDELLDAFWPDVGPDVARNRLLVAVSGLRRTLREITNLQVIEYANGGYRLDPELRVDVDVEHFEQDLSAARRAERGGDLKAALAGYRETVDRYRGDFASDAPYEQWTLLPRESLRLTYIDALDRCSRIQLSVGRLDDCIATGHRMLDVDPCREDAHRLLMRCYASLGRTYQALRQYELCCRILTETLETEPAPETIQLYRSIRTGAPRVPVPID